MNAIVWPSNPTIDQIFANNGTLWQWDGVKWVHFSWGGGEPLGPPGPVGPPGPPGPAGEAGTSVHILGSKPDQQSLPDTGMPGDAWLISGELWVWALDPSGHWENVGNIQGPQGPPGFVPEPFGAGAFGRTQNGNWQATLPLNGGTLSGALTLSGNAGAALQAVPLQQLNTATNDMATQTWATQQINTATTGMATQTWVTGQISTATSGMATQTWVTSQLSTATNDMATQTWVNTQLNGYLRLTGGTVTGTVTANVTGTALDINSTGGPSLRVRNSANDHLSVASNGLTTMRGLAMMDVLDTQPSGFGLGVINRAGQKIPGLGVENYGQGNGIGISNNLATASDFAVGLWVNTFGAPGTFGYGGCGIRVVANRLGPGIEAWTGEGLQSTWTGTAAGPALWIESAAKGGRLIDAGVQAGGANHELQAMLLNRTGEMILGTPTGTAVTGFGRINLGGATAGMYLNGVAYAAPSDPDLKTDMHIAPAGALEQLAEIPVLHFRWKDDDGKAHIGFSAVDVHRVLGEDIGCTVEGSRNYSIPEMLAVLWQAVQELELRTRKP